MAPLPASIIITRAEPGASETAERLRAHGFDPIIAPMLKLVPLPETPLPEPEALSGLVFTSANGVRTYIARREDRDLTAWCVGPATAQAARDAGFEDIRESAGNAVDLAKFILEGETRSEKPLLHIANRAAAGILKATLQAAGRSVEFAPIYEMKPAETLPDDAVSALCQSETPTLILVHSEKGAQAFAMAARSHKITAGVGIAISDRAAHPLDPLHLAATYIAAAPNEDGLVAALETAIATLSA